MRRITIVLKVFFWTTMYALAQEEPANELRFHLAAEELTLYDFHTKTTGSRFEYQFEDTYTIKLTNKVYKIALLFDENKTQAVQSIVASLLEGSRAPTGFQQMLWQKTGPGKKPIYTIGIVDGKLKITIYRKEIGDEEYALINKLGRRLLLEINS